MSHWKSFGLAIVAAVCLMSETTGSAYAQYCFYSSSLCAVEWSGGSTIRLGGLSGPLDSGSTAYGINNSGQAVGATFIEGTGNGYATEWSGGRAISLANPTGSTFSYALSINDAGQAVGYSVGGVSEVATEWSGGNAINLGGLPGSTGSYALSINNAGQAVGESAGSATEWSGGNAINLGGLPGSTGSQAFSINNAGQAVGFSVVGGSEYATEWSGGNVINLGSGIAYGINDSGQVVGESADIATEWSDGNVIALGPGGSEALSIDNAGQAVGVFYEGDRTYPVEWSGGTLIGLGNFAWNGAAYGINDAGQVVGYINTGSVPEPSTWAMMLLGFAGLAFGWLSRRAKAGHATLSRARASVLIKRVLGTCGGRSRRGADYPRLSKTALHLS